MLTRADIRNRQSPFHLRGSAVLAVLVLIAVMSVYLVSNAISLNVLKREIRLIEQKQTNPARTNRAPAAASIPMGINVTNSPPSSSTPQQP